MTPRISIAVVSSQRLKKEILPYSPVDVQHPPLGRLQPSFSPFKGKTPLYPNEAGGYSVFTPEQGEIHLRREFHSHIEHVVLPISTQILLRHAVGQDNFERMQLKLRGD